MDDQARMTGAGAQGQGPHPDMAELDVLAMDGPGAGGPGAPDAVRSINCTNCGAGLPVLGGGRVITQVCGYCGAALDATDAFRVLDVYAGMERPATPFRLGMEGEIEGVRFTVVGIKGMIEPGYGEWVDHMLFSPTHGYAWLTLESGHLVFSRKVRDLPRGAWLTYAMVERAETKPGRAHRGLNYIYYETTNWRTDFVEGAFNYRPARGDEGTTISLVGYGGPVPRMLHYVQPDTRGGEREVEISRYVPEAAAAFGVAAPAPLGIHPLQPYEASPNKGFYRLWFAGMVAASILLLVGILTIRGGTDRLVQAPVARLPVEATLEVTDTQRAVRVVLDTDLNNSWAEFDLTVTGPTGTAVIDQPFPLSYYWGYSDGERWSEGSASRSWTFLPPIAGPYTVAVARPTGEAVDQNRVSSVSIDARQGVMPIRWPILAIIVFTLLLAGTFLSKTRFAMRRASGSDWTEE